MARRRFLADRTAACLVGLACECPNAASDEGLFMAEGGRTGTDDRRRLSLQVLTSTS